MEGAVGASAQPVALTALLCRTSDRAPGGALGAAALAEELSRRLGAPARTVGSPPAEPAPRHWSDDLESSRGCLREAGHQVGDALGGGRLPVLLAGDCSICVATLPAVARRVPDVRVLWLDAHGDFNTPDTTASDFLGGMCLAGACGRWDTGFDGTLDPHRVLLVGGRDLDVPEAAELAAAGVERRAEIGDALDGHDVYVHLDLDVLDPGFWPAQFPAPGGMSLEGLAEALAGAARAARRIVGVEVTAFDAPQDPAERARLTGLAADAIMPLLGPV